MEFNHDFFSNNGGRKLLFTHFTQVTFQVINKFFDNIHTDVAFLTRFLNSAANFLPIKNLPATIFLDDHNRDFFNVFVGGEATAAIDTFPASTDHTRIFA